MYRVLFGLMMAMGLMGGCSAPLTGPITKDGVMLLEKEEDLPANLALVASQYVQAPPAQDLSESRSRAVAFATSASASHILHKRVAYSYNGEVLVAVYEAYAEGVPPAGRVHAKSAGDVMVVRSDRAVEGLQLLDTWKMEAGNTNGVKVDVATNWAFQKGADVVRFRHEHPWPLGMKLVLEAYRFRE